MSTLGERLRSRRKALDLSQEAVARRTGIGLQAYGDLERGRTVDPHVSTLMGLSRALDTTVAELAEEPAPLVDAPQESGPLITRNIEESLEVRDSVKATIFGHLDALEAALKAHGLNGQLLDMVDEMRERVAA